MKLLIASPCRLVLTDKESGYGHSLIAIFHHMKIRLPKTAEVPPNAVLPMEWSVFTKWMLDPQQSERSVKQVVEAFWPNGEPLFKHELKALEILDNQAAFTIRNTGFPMGQGGTIRISLSIYVDEQLAHDPVELKILVELIKDLPA